MTQNNNGTKRLLIVLPVFFIVSILGGPDVVFAQVDLSGEWRLFSHEDTIARTGTTFGDYVGIPLNDAGRLKAESWDPAVRSLVERQCIPHPMQYAEHSISNRDMRIWKVVDQATQQLIAYQKRGAWMEPQRTIWMDGRPHPPEYAAHTWQGFSTGRWEGNMLTVVTTHLKTGWLQPNGVTASEKTVMTEHFVRHGNYLTNITVIEDPVYLTEPFLRSSTWVLDDRLSFRPYPCGANEITEEIPRPAGTVPHFLPGANPWLTEHAVKVGLPYEATRGGAETTYPEYMEKLKTMKAATPIAGQVSGGTSP